MHNFCNLNNSIIEGLTHAAFYKPTKHNQCITVKQFQPVPGAGSESTTVTVNNPTQQVCKVSAVSVYRHQQAHQLLNYQECQRHASMLGNGFQEDVHVKRFLLHTTSSSS